MYSEVKDSGARQDFDTGSVRDTNEGKGRYDLISPIALQRLAQHTQNGAVKYGDRNWEKGQPCTRFFDSATRHLFKYLEGHRDEDHLSAALWNIMGIIHVEEMVRRGKLPADLVDWPMFVDNPPTEFDWKARGLPEPEEGWRYTGEFRLPEEEDYYLPDIGSDGQYRLYSGPPSFVSLRFPEGNARDEGDNYGGRFRGRWILEKVA